MRPRRSCCGALRVFDGRESGDVVAGWGGDERPESVQDGSAISSLGRCGYRQGNKGPPFAKSETKKFSFLKCLRYLRPDGPARYLGPCVLRCGSVGASAGGSGQRFLGHLLLRHRGPRRVPLALEPLEALEPNWGIWADRLAAAFSAPLEAPRRWCPCGSDPTHRPPFWRNWASGNLASGRAFSTLRPPDVLALKRALAPKAARKPSLNRATTSRGRVLVERLGRPSRSGLGLSAQV